MSSPGIVHKVQFIQSSSQIFSGFVDYINRDEAIRNEQIKSFSLFNDYMGNPEKTSGMFSNDKNNLSETEKENVKSIFQFAQENESLMWQDVFSFDNKWLEKNGLLNTETGVLDEGKIMNAVRRSMNVMMKNENMTNSAVWLGAIHHNTDNLHVHVATVEVPKTRDRGKRKPKTLQQMKSTFANDLLDLSKENAKINDLIRKQIIEEKRSHSIESDTKMKIVLKSFMKQLPKEDLRKWNYAYMKNLGLQESLDELSKYYIETYRKNEFKELQTILEKQKDIYRETYGDGTKEKKLYEHFVENKNKDLYKRLGNVLLKEMKEIHQKQSRINEVLINKNTSSTTRYRHTFIRSKDFKRIKQALINELDHFKNKIAYERLEQEIQFENER